MIKNLIFCLLSFVVLNVSAFEKYNQRNPIVVQPFVSDGPYVFSKNKSVSVDAIWLCKGQVIKQKLVTTDLPLSIKACELPAKIHSLNNKESTVLEYQGDYTVAALSDFHGQYDLMIKLLTNNQIINEDKKWSFGNGHFVITGDIFDRGDKVTEILWFLYDLEKQAEAAGGKIHLTLGNHEVMILNGDLRYLNAKYLTTSKKLNIPFEQLFSKNSILGNWLRSKPVLVKVNNNLFAHGGFHPSLAKENHSLEAINTVFKTNLIKDELAQPREGWGKYLHKSNGPIWYRGYFKSGDEGASSQEIDLLLKHFDINHIIVGHTSQKQIETRYQGRVIAIDSSIKKGEYGEILFIESAKEKEDEMWRGSLAGEKLKLK